LRKPFQVNRLKIKALEEAKTSYPKNQASFIKEGVKPAQIKEELTANERSQSKASQRTACRGAKAESS
jgi:hypothetical protein